MKAVDEGGDHGAVEEWVFAVDLFAAAPARIAREVGLRTPEHEELAVVPGRLRDVTGFVAFDAGGLFDERGVPGFAQANGLRELRGGDGVAAAAAALVAGKSTAEKELATFYQKVLPPTGQADNGEILEIDTSKLPAVLKTATVRIRVH